MLSALFSISEDFVISTVQEIQSLRNHLPIFRVFRFPFKTFLRNQFSQQIRLFLTPVVGSKVDLLKTKPLEHAWLACNSGNNGCDGLPILCILNKRFHTISFYISSKPFLSAYFEITQISICTSSSLQFFLIRLFLIILHLTKSTFQSGDSSSWGWINHSCRLNIFFPFCCFASSGQGCPLEFMYSGCPPARLQSHKNDLWHCTTLGNAHGCSSYFWGRIGPKRKITTHFPLTWIDCCDIVSPRSNPSLLWFYRIIYILEIFSEAPYQLPLP